MAFKISPPRFRDPTTFALTVVILTGVGLSAWMLWPESVDSPKMTLPVDCTPGKDCFVQNYVDVDPGVGWRDFACFSLSYDGHKGTDFRLADMKEMEKGVAVLAAAPGFVKRSRNNQDDGVFFSGDRNAVRDIECGNGVLIDHGDGWETQYCHLRKGSVEVNTGDEVQAGDRLGLVGMSGAAEFVHLHFELRKRVTRNEGKDTETDEVLIIDPFTNASAQHGCTIDEHSLWTGKARNKLKYQDSGIVNFGFTTQPPTMEGVERGLYRDQVIDSSAPALVAYVRMFGLRRGDRQIFALTGPDGEDLARSNEMHNERDKAQFLLFAGKSAEDEPLAPGTYEARYKLYREGEQLIDRKLTIDLSPPSS